MGLIEYPLTMLHPPSQQRSQFHPSARGPSHHFIPHLLPSLDGSVELEELYRSGLFSRTEDKFTLPFVIIPFPLRLLQGSVQARDQHIEIGTFQYLLYFLI